MAGANYYILAALPALGEFGSDPPLSPAALLAMMDADPSPRALVEAILLGDDLHQRQAFVAGETQDVVPAVLRIEQVRDAAPLPGFLIAESPESPPHAPTDAVWAAYYRHAAGVAAQGDSQFLADWIAREVALRNALVEARARALELESQPYLVAPELGDPHADFTAVLNQWASAPTPLAGLQVLDRDRWEWLATHDAWFSFDDDELAAYAAKLMLLHRWHRLETAAAAPADADLSERTAP